MRCFYRLRPPPQLINVFNIGAFTANIGENNHKDRKRNSRENNDEISYTKNQDEERERERKQEPEEASDDDRERSRSPLIQNGRRRRSSSNSHYRDFLEQKSTVKKKLFREGSSQFGQIVEEEKSRNLELAAQAKKANKTTTLGLLLLSLPGLRFDDEQQLPKRTAGIEFLDLTKLRKLLTWSQKKSKQQEQEPSPTEAVMVEEEEEEEAVPLPTTITTAVAVAVAVAVAAEETRDRQSFELFRSYFLGHKPSTVKVQNDQELVAVETFYYPAKRMRASNHGRFGRFYGAGACMQSFEKQRRAYLCEGIYWDIDQVNSHPSLLLSLLQNLNHLPNLVITKITIPKLLQEYVETRDEVLAQIAASYQTGKAIAKKLMLRLMYGGTTKNWVLEHRLGAPSDEMLEQKLTWFTNDLRSINDKLQQLPLFAKVLKVYHDTYDRKERTSTSFLSLICGEVERQVLLFVKRWLSVQAPRRDLDVLIHDGGLMRRLTGETNPPERLLLELNQALQAQFNTTHIKYAYKQFSNVLAAEIDQESLFYY